MFWTLGAWHMGSPVFHSGGLQLWFATCNHRTRRVRTPIFGGTHFPPPPIIMNDKEDHVYDALGRVVTFGVTHAEMFAPTSTARTDFTRAGVIYTELGPPDQQRGTPASPFTGNKAVLIAELRDDLILIAGTARTIDVKQPGFAAAFSLGPDTQRDTLASAAAFLVELEKPGVAAAFLAYSMDASFVQDLTDDIREIKGTKDGQEEDQQEDSGKTARERALIKEARTLIRSLTTSVKNRFRRDPEVLAKWKTASHIQRSPRPTQTPKQDTQPTA